MSLAGSPGRTRRPGALSVERCWVTPGSTFPGPGSLARANPVATLGSMDAPPVGVAQPRSAPETQVVHERTHVAARPWRVRMSGRDPREEHRASTPLELLFDLCFVVAVAQAGAALHHDLTEGAVAHGVFAYLVVFFTIWWPWLNFTWFASAYDTDDVAYRLLVFVQIAGVLIVAAGVPRIFADLDFRIAVIGYVLMRLSLVALWLRAAREDPDGRPVALHFAAGIGLVQILWIVRLVIDGGPAGIVLLFAFGAIELRDPGLGRALGTAYTLASGAHRRALRAVHDHRSGRMHPRRDDRDPGGAHR